MSEMPERIWACRWVGSEDGAVRFEHQLWFSQSLQGPNDTEYVRADIVAGKNAEIERLRKALDQAVDAGSLDIVTVVKDKSYGMWRYEGVECIVGQSSTENFFAGHIEDNDELAAYLRERVAFEDTRPPDTVVQNVVQNGEAG